MSLTAIPCCFAVLAGTLKSVYLSIMLVDFYHHLELWRGVRTKLSSSQAVQGKSGLQEELVLHPKYQHFCPSLAPVHRLHYQCLEIHGINGPILHIWRQS